ncbi:hypothetical protein X546_17730 [Brevibacillus borstelensis cifa_chp40]|nr:hypothetical protein X546_17730 [Brevibacillus borstelensis cifa_chp40]
MNKEKIYGKCLHRKQLFPATSGYIAVSTQKKRAHLCGGPGLEKLFPISFFFQYFHCFPETKRVNDLPFTQEFQTVLQIHVIGHIDQPLIGRSRFFLCGDVFVEVGDGIAYCILRSEFSA